MEKSNWQKIEVGTPYIEGRTSYKESTHFNYIDTQYQLLLCLKSPTKYEISSVKKGLASFRVLIYEEIIFFLFKFKPDLPWSDAPYHISAVPKQARTKPERIIEPDSGILITIVLIDADTGITKSLRAIGLPHDFSNKLIDAIAHQYDNPLTSEQYNDRINKAYLKYTTTIDMVQASQF